MKHTWLFKSSRILVGLWVLALLAVSPSTVQADEIWVEPAPIGKKPLGNWTGSPLKKSIGFAWHVPNDMVGTADSATIFVISLKDGDIGYQIDTSHGIVGDPQDASAVVGTPQVLLGTIAGELAEISVPLPALIAGDYVSVKLLRVEIQTRGGRPALYIHRPQRGNAMSERDLPERRRDL